MSDFAGRVLKLVAESDYRPMTLKMMSRRFKVGPDEYPEFRAAVKGLVRQGQLTQAGQVGRRKEV